MISIIHGLISTELCWVKETKSVPIGCIFYGSIYILFCIFYDSIYILFCKWQNFRYGEQFSGCKRLGTRQIECRTEVSFNLKGKLHALCDDGFFFNFGLICDDGFTNLHLKKIHKTKHIHKQNTHIYTSKLGNLCKIRGLYQCQYPGWDSFEDVTIGGNCIKCTWDFSV